MHALTIAGYPADNEVGPFCPTTTADTAADAGIWFDGNDVYDLDGAFILNLPELYNDDHWHLYDDEGNVHVTDTQEAFEAAARPNVDPEYQNHCVEGRIEWLDGGVPVTTTVLIPTTPVAAASSSSTNGNLGVTLNGVIIAQSAPVQAILGAYTIAAFDDCGGHINPVDGYHVHGATGCSEAGEAPDDETPVFAYALDGYAIHSPLAAAAEAAAGLDACQGHTTEADGYHYHAASVAENAILSCFTGVTVGSGGPPNDGPPGGGPPGAATATATPVATTAATPIATPTPSANPTDVGSNYLGSYAIEDTGFGTEVNVVVDSDAKTRTIVSNALPNHETGDFPNPGNPNTISAQDKTWTYPTEPTFLGRATFAREPGVAINGLKFEPGTAERATCEGGETHSIEAIQDVVDLGLDFNNAHVQPTGEYHYHGVSNLLVELYSTDEDLVHVAFAADGHLIYYSKSGAYQSSYRLGQGDREGTNCSYTNGGSGATTDFGAVKTVN